MYAPSHDDLVAWSNAVLTTALDTSAPQPQIGYWGRHLAEWIHDRWGILLDTYHDPLDLDGATAVLRPALEAIIWDPSKNSERQDLFQSEDIFNYSDYVWMVPILNSDVAQLVYPEHRVVDVICKAVFLSVAYGVWDDDDTTLLSEYLTADLEARGRSRQGIDDNAGHESFKLLLYFYMHYDTMQTTDGKLPFPWLLAGWRNLDVVRSQWATREHI